jgi:hypothetical protein
MSFFSSFFLPSPLMFLSLITYNHCGRSLQNENEVTITVPTQQSQISEEMQTYHYFTHSFINDNLLSDWFVHTPRQFSKQVPGSGRYGNV